MPWCLPADRQGGIGRPVCRQAGAQEIEMLEVYAISSLNHNYIYVGMTNNLDARVKRHNDGRERTTKPYRPFKLIFKESCETRPEARLREKYWKSGIGKEKLRTLRNSLK
jgi:putative endonuclease